MSKPITVLLVDDHAVVRAGFKMLLTTDPRFQVIAEAERGEAAIQLYVETQPEVMVLDLSMPGIGGLETLRRVCNRDKAAKVLVFSVHDESVYIDRALSAGAKGYITKHAHPDILMTAISEIAAGGIYIEPGLTANAHMTTESAQTPDYKTIIDQLSAREFDVFLLLAKGLTAHKIADELCLGYKTVANYGTQIRTKLNVSSVAELAHIAIALGVMKK